MTTKEYWNSRYKNGGDSGYGSYDEQLGKKLKWLSDLNITSISELGCGDFNFGKALLYMYPTAAYMGSDISSVMVTQLQKDYPKISFTTDNQDLQQADLVLCIDVLFHILEDDEYEKTLDIIENIQTKYLAITAYEYDQDVSAHVKIRKFDYERFGEPLIREVVEEDGQLYFYLFEKDSIDLGKVSACLMTKDPTYPQQILQNVGKYPFGEVLIMTHSDSPYNKYELFKKAKFDTIYYQDDDAIIPIDQLLEKSKPGEINVGMKEGHAEQYKDMKMTMGLGWGSFFQRKVLDSLHKYTDKFGEDELFTRDTEKILTEINFPQNRIILPVEDLPSAMAPDRLWRQPQHWTNMDLIKERCATI